MSPANPDTLPAAALVIGATGDFGDHMTTVLLARGWRVKALNRRPAAAAKAKPHLAVEWIKGDAMSAADVTAAAEGCAIIVHAANPPGYKNWRGLAIPMLASAIAAAKAAGARIVMPGNVYNYDPRLTPVIDEASPQRPVSAKGQVRVEMEEMLEAAAAEHGVRSLTVRAGDFFGPRSDNGWVSGQMVQRGKPVRSVVYPGARTAAHAFAYLPDLAETTMRLIERRAGLADFTVFHFAGHAFHPGVSMAKALAAAGGHPDAPIKGFIWPVVFALSPFVAMFRELLEMRYLWKQSLTLDNARLVDFLGAEPHTPIDQALKATLADMGRLPAKAEKTVPPSIVPMLARP
jgi:nucleoside-diphosphate-sugar epimerase